MFFQVQLVFYVSKQRFSRQIGGIGKELKSCRVHFRLRNLENKLFLLFNHLVMSNSLPPHRQQPSRPLLSMGFPRQEYWSRLPFSPLRDLPEPGIKLAFAGRVFITESPGKPRGQMVLFVQQVGIFMMPDMNTMEKLRFCSNFGQFLFLMFYSLKFQPFS